MARRTLAAPDGDAAAIFWLTSFHFPSFFIAPMSPTVRRAQVTARIGVPEWQAILGFAGGIV
jgi:hypothetical protein